MARTWSIGQLWGEEVRFDFLLREAGSQAQFGEVRTEGRSWFL